MAHPVVVVAITLFITTALLTIFIFIAKSFVCTLLNCPLPPPEECPSPESPILPAPIQQPGPTGPGCLPQNYPLTASTTRHVISKHFAEARPNQALLDIKRVVREPTVNGKRPEEERRGAYQNRVFDVWFSYSPTKDPIKPDDDYVRMYFVFRRQPCGWHIYQEGGRRSGINALNAPKDEL